MRRFILIASALAVASCAGFPGGSVDAPSVLRGNVAFGDARHVQATMGDVATSATVSLISATKNKTIITTLTDENGRFMLDLADWRPDPAEFYYLEAIKGLGENRAGNSAVRVRTIGQYKSGAWRSLSAGPTIWLTRATTALSIIASHLGSNAVPPSGLIGTLIIGTPDVFSANGTGITRAQFDTVVDLVDLTLARNNDPLDRIQYADGAFFSKPDGAAGLSATAVPMAAPVGAPITIYGVNFIANPLENAVSFNGAAATPGAASSTQLTVTVPAGATSGTITITNGNGTVQIPGFTVIPEPTGQINAN